VSVKVELCYLIRERIALVMICDRLKFVLQCVDFSAL